MILVVGNKGSMGKRYEHILKFLGKDYKGIDKETGKGALLNLSEQADHIILATPTSTHYALLKYIAPATRARVLCEKPVVPDIDMLRQVLDLDMDLSVMMQYMCLDDPDSEGDSYYNYFRHGNDGLVWDCYQIIALARGKVMVDETSAVWTCKLNGKDLSLNQMDGAYIQYLSEWLDGHKPLTKMQILEHHIKVKDYYEQRQKA